MPVMSHFAPQHERVFESPNVQFIQSNLCMRGGVERAFENMKFQYVVDLAAETRYSLKDAVYDEKILDVANLVGQVLCEYQQQNGCVRRFIYMSTAQVYKANTTPSREDSRIEPWTGVAKGHLKAEVALQGMDGLPPMTILRPANIYGVGDVSGIMPRIVCAAIYKYLGQTMKFLWTGDLKLNTVHVHDVVRALWFLCEIEEALPVVNLTDEANSDQNSLNITLEQIFGIATGFMGNMASSAACVAMNMVVSQINENHMNPWAKMISLGGIGMTPYSPFLDKELLYNKSLCVSGAFLSQQGFDIEHPAPTVEELMAVLTIAEEQGLFPHWQDYDGTEQFKQVE